MARCLLISFSGYPTTPSSLLPDNGLAALAAALLDAGHPARILDLNTIRTMDALYPPEIARAVRPLARAIFCEGAVLSWRERLRLFHLARRLERRQVRAIEGLAGEVARSALAWRPDLVGLKLWNGDGFTGSIRIARALRAALPGVPIAGGGPHVDYFHHHIHAYTDAFDVLVRGDGERAIVHLCEWAEGNRGPEEVEGAIWGPGAGGRGSQIRGRRTVLLGTPIPDPRSPATDCPCIVPDLNATPAPVYDPAVYPALAGGQKIRIGVLEESRGCPQRCSFCIHPVKSGGRRRVKSPERILEEIDGLRRVLRTNTFVYAGSNTPADTAVACARGILERGWRVRYGCFGHARGMQAADFPVLKRSGCETIFYGIESGSPRLLAEVFHKSASADDIRQAILATKAAGIFTIGSIIFPAPFETAETRQETLRLLEELRPDSVPVTPPGVIPGTPWHREPERYGIRFTRRRNLYARGMTYKIRLLFPPWLWKPLPYTVNGQSSRRFLRETGGFVKELEANGFLTNVPHELALMAQVLGKSARDFRNEARAAFLSRDVDWTADVVDRLNRAVEADRQPCGTPAPGCGSCAPEGGGATPGDATRPRSPLVESQPCASC